MKIALLGYGKMGKIIEQVAQERGHTIVLTISANSKDYNLDEADVAIDFSVPDAAFTNISKGLKNGIPVISGTTGWLNDYNAIVTLCKETQGAFLYASNFSLGVNVFFYLNRQLAKTMSKLSQYKVNITEIHHTEKLDAPSGTAISLAEDIIDLSDYSNWHLMTSDESKSIPIKAKRIDNVAGTHIVQYESNIDDITITHTSHSRRGFALGAIIAAEWIQGKTGVFSMKDVLNIG